MNKSLLCDEWKNYDGEVFIFFRIMDGYKDLWKSNLYDINDIKSNDKILQSLKTELQIACENYHIKVDLSGDFLKQWNKNKCILNKT